MSPALVNSVRRNIYAKIWITFSFDGTIISAAATNMRKVR